MSFWDNIWALFNLRGARDFRRPVFSFQVFFADTEQL